MLTDLCDDIQGVLLTKLNNISLVILCHVNKSYHRLVSLYGKNNTINRTLKCHKIASHGYLEVLKWARENECSWNSKTCSCAAKNGHLEVLKWARENKCPWNSNTCSCAAKNGHIEVLKWARENECNWNSYTCYTAAVKGQLEVLKWAIENGCDFGPIATNIAKQKWPQIFDQKN
jgi:hypothetical protein